MSRLMKGNISAVDTETVNGYAIILANERRAWTADSFKTCIRPIISDIKKQKMSGRIMCYNLKYDANAILKYLTDENLFDLLGYELNGKTIDYETSEKIPNETVFEDRYKIIYVQDKFLRIKDLKLKKTISMFDLAQFYNHGKLEDIGQKYLNEGKINNCVTECITTRAQLQTDRELMWTFGYHKKEIMEYCIQDALLTKKLGMYLSDRIYELFGFRLSSYASKMGIGRKLITKTVGNVNYASGKSHSAYPYFMGASRAGKFGRAAYHGGIFDCNRRGTFEKCTDADISSAYPHFMRSLPNWSNGNFVPVETGDISDKDVYGWISATFDYPFVPRSSSLIQSWFEVHDYYDPVEVFANNTKKFYPDGKRWQIITLAEFRFLKEHGYLTDKNYEGYVWRQDFDKPQHPDPFTWINDVYEEKCRIKEEIGKDSYLYSLTKIPMNGGYGLTAQTKGGLGTFMNFFYASTITAQTRVQICEMLEEIGYDKAISIATDGILLEGDITLDDKYTKGGLGSWDVEKWDQATIIANGIYRLERNHTDPKKRVKQGLRGMMSYDGNLRTDMEKHRNMEKFVPAEKYRPITMFQGMKWKTHGYSKHSINQFVKTGRLLSCKSDSSKNWEGINTFDDLLEGNFYGNRFTVEEVDKLSTKDLNKLKEA